MDTSYTYSSSDGVGGDDSLLTPLAGQAQRTWRRWVGRAAFASGGLLSAMIAGAFFVVDAVTRASKVTSFDTYTFTPFELDLPSEDVQITAANGDTLSGWWLPRPETDRVILVCYGYRNRKADMLGIGAALWRNGYNVLIFDYHGHGVHAGTRVTLGYRELEDALAAVRYISLRIPSARLGVVGFSMGASIAIMAAARDARIDAVVADSPFAAQRNPISMRMRQRYHISWSGRPVLFFADHLLHWLLGYRFSDVEPIRDIARLGDRPILLIHGMKDTVVDPADSTLLFEAATGPKELWQLQNAEHCGAYFADRKHYVKRTVDFFDRALSGDHVRAAAVEEVEFEQQEQRDNQDNYQKHKHNGQPRVSAVGIRLIAFPRLHLAHLHRRGH
jgi:dipeptidyl aminopeptidase/acylaminoacyl peptidase